MKNFKNHSFLTLALLSSTAFAMPGPTELPLVHLGNKIFNFVTEFASSDDYQIGEEWGKKPVTAESLQGESEAFRLAAYRTARVGGATGFFLGAYNGEFVMATNHHVIESQSQCRTSRVRFDFLQINTACERILGSWTDVDLTIFVVNLTAADANKLLPYAKNFSFDRSPAFNQDLMTFGYGVGANPQRRLVGNQDSDCRVFSKQGDIRFIADPDAFNPGPYKTWSFANGCDVSHGDSGSAMVDRASGDIVGIIWTGKIPKDPKVRSAAYLRDIQAQQSSDIWNELSYAAPADKMKEVLNDYLNNNQVNARDRATLISVLQ